MHRVLARVRCWEGQTLVGAMNCAPTFPLERWKARKYFPLLAYSKYGTLSLRQNSRYLLPTLAQMCPSFAITKKWCHKCPIGPKHSDTNASTTVQTILKTVSQMSHWSQAFRHLTKALSQPSQGSQWIHHSIHLKGQSQMSQAFHPLKKTTTVIFP